MAIFPFTISPNLDVLNQLFLSAIMTSMLLGIVLTTNHIFDEDASDDEVNISEDVGFGDKDNIVDTTVVPVWRKKNSRKF